MNQNFDNALDNNKLQILQPEKGYRYSIDPFLLADFADCPAGAKVIDLGTGSGVIALLLSQNPMVEKIVGLELQQNLAECARRNIDLNNRQNIIEIKQGDVRCLPKNLVQETFDVVVTNPPYRRACSGRLSKGIERSHARHELAGGLKDFLSAAKYLLKPTGRIFMIYLAERLPELMHEMRIFLLEPKRLRMVYSRLGSDARLVLVEGRKNSRGGIKIQPPLYIYQGKGRDYTEEVDGICKGRSSLV